MVTQQHCTVLLSQAQRRAITDLLPHLADRLKLAEKNLRTISFTPDELASIRDKAKTAHPRAENGMKRNFLRHVVDIVTKAIEDSKASEKLKLGKGAAFVKSRLKRLPQEDGAWEVQRQVEEMLKKRGRPASETASRSGLSC